MAKETENDDLDGIIVNTESASTKVSKGYRYFYRGAYVKAKEDEIKVNDLIRNACRVHTARS